MDYKTILNEATNLLKKHNINSPRLDSELLLSNSLNITRENLLLNLNSKIKIKESEYFKSLLNKRFRKMPMAYILGYWRFNHPVQKQLGSNLINLIYRRAHNYLYILPVVNFLKVVLQRKTIPPMENSAFSPLNQTELFWN